MLTIEYSGLYMRLSGDQARYWTCISIVSGCTHCNSEERNELVLVTLEGEKDFVISLCAACIGRIKVPTYMLLRGRLSPEAYSNIALSLQSARQLCEECKRDESIWRIFSLGPEGHKGHFICGACSQRWNSQGEAGLPNIMATMHNKDRAQ